MEQEFNFKNGRDRTFIKHLLLGGDVRDLTDDDNFDPTDMKVELKINGYDVLIEDFNTILDDWSNRITRKIKDDLEYMSKEKSIVDNAEILIKEKLGKAYEVLQSIEDDMWKLGV